MSMLEAKNLSVERGGKTVLDGVTFEVGEREVFALLGGNGAGKSTTLLTFLGLLDVQQGQVLAQGKPITEDLATIRAKMAYLPESAALYGHLNVMENLSYFLALGRLEQKPADLEAALLRVGLQPSDWHQPVATYSKGMRQKAAIALALLRETPILLLDEPTSGLDPVAIDSFNTLVSELAAQGSTVLMVTHDVYGACQVAHRIGLLQQGQIVGIFERAGDTQIETEAVHAAFSQSVNDTKAIGGRE